MAASLTIQEAETQKTEAQGTETLGTELDAHNLWSALVEVRTKAAQYSQEAETARNEAKRLHEKIQRLERECHYFQKSAESKQIDFKTLQELEESLNQRCSIQAVEIERLRQKSAAADRRMSEIESLKARENEKELDNKKENNRLQELGLELEEKRQEIFRIQSTQSPVQEQVVQVSSSELERYESRLKKYAIALNLQKNKMKKISTQLAYEIDSAKTVHPLQDYLAFTEFELARFELQLKKTSPSSPERPKLEICLTQLVEQQNFLRAVIEESQKKLQEQALKVRQILKDGALAPLPPTPPPLSKEGTSSKP